MAIYSLSTTSIKRSNGRSAVAAAAYRAGSEIVNECTGLVHDYTRKSGVEHVEIFTRGGIPAPGLSDLWNAAERAEKRRDARTAREVLVALPAELDAAQRLALARQLSADLSERYGVAVQLAVHAPDRGGDQRNHHGHLLLTTRVYGHDGLGEKSQLEWSGTQCRKNGVAQPADELKMLRERWADMQNDALERADVAARVDHRSLAEQGIERVPQVHVGPMGTEQIRRGTPEESERASLNLEIQSVNAEVTRLRDRLDAELEAQEQREWEEWTSRPDVDPITGRIVTEFAVDACIQRERNLPENRPPAPPAGRVVPWPPAHDPKLGRLKRAVAPAARQQEAAQPVVVDVPQPPPHEPIEIDEDAVAAWYAVPTTPAFDARALALAIVQMATPGERAGAVRSAALTLDLDDFDALDIELEPLMVGATGDLLPAGQRLRDEVLPPPAPEAGPSQHAERVQRRSGPRGPGI